MNQSVIALPADTKPVTVEPAPKPETEQDRDNRQARGRTGSMFRRFRSDEKGATAIEYALIASVMGIGLLVGLIPLKAQINAVFDAVVAELKKT